MQNDPYETRGVIARPVSESGVESRANFLLKTYAHVCAALSGFALVEIALFKLGIADQIVQALSGARYGWLMVLGAFTLVGWMCTTTAHKVRSVPMQYVALVGYVIAEALIFVPLLWYANARAPGTIATAAYLSFFGFAGLTAVAFVIRKDFSFLRGILMWGGICAALAIVGSLIFGFELGTWFSAAMIAFAGAAILYKTSAVMLHYPEDRYVAASLELFAAVALLFYYVLMLLNRRR